MCGHIINVLIFEGLVFVRGIATGVGDIMHIHEYHGDIAGAVVT